MVITQDNSKGPSGSRVPCGLAVLRTATQLSFSLCPSLLPSQERSLINILLANLCARICSPGNPVCDVVPVLSSSQPSSKNPAAS